MNKPKIVTLCGSTKFKQEFEEANKDFTLKGFIVLSVGFFMHKESTPITEEQKQNLDDLHKRKIDLSDMIYVINPKDYIGASTKSEIQYAYNTGKLVQFAEPTNYDFSKTQL